MSVVAITMTHPKNIVRLQQALAHTSIVTGRAKAASELELMRAQSILENAQLDRVRERTRREAEYLAEVEKLIAVEERKRAMIAAISDPEIRAALARELGVVPRQAQTITQQRHVQTSNWGPQQQQRGNGAVLD